MVPVTPEGTVAVMVTLLPHVLGPEVVTVTVGVALLTTWVRFADAVLLFVSPPYCAVMALLPRGSEDVVTVARPPLIVPVPSGVAPFINETLPVTPLGNVAVNVTDWLKSDGFAEEASVIDGVALSTAWTSDATDALLFPSPL
jgi:hypothetical protein